MNPVVERFLDKEKSRVSEQTYKNRKSDIENFTGWLEREDRGDVTELEIWDIDDYLMWQGRKNEHGEQHYAPGTVKARYGSLSLLFEFLAMREKVDDNPLRKDGALPRAKFDTIMSEKTKKSATEREELPSVTPEEKDLIIEHCRGPKLRNKLVLRLLWQTAVRQRELTNIRIEDIDRENRSIRIRSDKTHENRVVGYWKNVDLLLDQWLEYGGRSAFPHVEGSPWLLVSKQNPKMELPPSDVVKQAAHNAGLHDLESEDPEDPMGPMYIDARGNGRWRITAHAFRHGAARNYLNNGMDIEKLRRYLGHANLETTKRYLRTSEKEVLDAVQEVGEASS